MFTVTEVRHGAARNGGDERLTSDIMFLLHSVPFECRHSTACPLIHFDASDVKKMSQMHSNQ